MRDRGGRSRGEWWAPPPPPPSSAFAALGVGGGAGGEGGSPGLALGGARGTRSPGPAAAPLPTRLPGQAPGQGRPAGPRVDRQEQGARETRRLLKREREEAAPAHPGAEQEGGERARAPPALPRHAQARGGPCVLWPCLSLSSPRGRRESVGGARAAATATALATRRRSTERLGGESPERERKRERRPRPRLRARHPASSAPPPTPGPPVADVPGCGHGNGPGVVAGERVAGPTGRGGGRPPGPRPRFAVAKKVADGNLRWHTASAVVARARMGRRTPPSTRPGGASGVPPHTAPRTGPLSLPFMLSPCPPPTGPTGPSACRPSRSRTAG